MSRTARLVLLMVACACAALASPGAAAAATAGCDAGAPNQTTWTGAAADHDWSTASNWSAGAPGASSYVCIPAGNDTINITLAALAQTMEAHRPLRVNGRSLTLFGPDPSTTDKTFRLSAGSLAGDGVLQIASGATLTWDGSSEMTGTGTTQLLSGSHLRINDAVNGANRDLNAGRTLAVHSGADAIWTGAD